MHPHMANDIYQNACLRSMAYLKKAEQIKCRSKKGNYVPAVWFLFSHSLNLKVFIDCFKAKNIIIFLMNSLKFQLWYRTLAIGNAFPIKPIESVNRTRRKEQKLFLFFWNKNQIKYWTNTLAICWLSNSDIIMCASWYRIW